MSDSRTIAIKNMVCPRCIKSVREVLESLGLMVEKLELGEAVVSGPDVSASGLKNALEAAGFELLEDKKARLVEQIKTFIIQMIREPESSNLNYSEQIARNLGKDYSSLSQLFSASENVTIEKYIILQKIELVKEWLVYDELSLSEMAYKLGYSSVAHLSSQFKQVTGFTPTEFKKLKNHNRKPLNEIGN